MRVNISRASVATSMRCGGIFKIAQCKFADECDSERIWQLISIS